MKERLPRIMKQRTRSLVFLAGWAAQQVLQPEELYPWSDLLNSNDYAQVKNCLQPHFTEEETQAFVQNCGMKLATAMVVGYWQIIVPLAEELLNRNEMSGVEFESFLHDHGGRY